MIKVYLDANILISLQITDHAFHKRAKKLLKSLVKNGSLFLLSPLTFDEYWYGAISSLRNLSIKYKNKSSSYFLKILNQGTNEILSWPNVQIANVVFTLETINKTMLYIKNYDLKPRDAFHLTYCLKNEVDFFATFDKDFSKLKKIKNLKIISS